VGESDTFLDVALQALEGNLKERLLLVSNVGKDVNRLLSAVGLCIVSF